MSTAEVFNPNSLPMIATEDRFATLPGGHKLFPGTYTVERASGEYRTLRVRENDNPDFFEGKGLKLEFLSGPDNTSDFTSFGLLMENGRLVIWKKFRGGAVEESLRFAVNVLLGDPATAGEAWAKESGCCYRCRRTLTVPTSLHRGLGPVCAEKMGF